MSGLWSRARAFFTPVAEEELARGGQGASDGVVLGAGISGIGVLASILQLLTGHFVYERFLLGMFVLHGVFLLGSVLWTRTKAGEKRAQLLWWLMLASLGLVYGVSWGIRGSGHSYKSVLLLTIPLASAGVYPLPPWSLLVLEVFFASIHCFLLFRVGDTQFSTVHLIYGIAVMGVAAGLVSQVHRRLLFERVQKRERARILTRVGEVGQQTRLIAQSIQEPLSKVEGRFQEVRSILQAMREEVLRGAPDHVLKGYEQRLRARLRASLEDTQRMGVRLNETRELMQQGSRDDVFKPQDVINDLVADLEAMYGESVVEIRSLSEISTMRGSCVVLRALLRNLVWALWTWESRQGGVVGVLGEEHEGMLRVTFVVETSSGPHMERLEVLTSSCADVVRGSLGGEIVYAPQEREVRLVVCMPLLHVVSALEGEFVPGFAPVTGGSL